MTKSIYVYVGPHRSGSQFLLSFIFSNLKGLCNMHTRDPDCNAMVWDAMDGHPMFEDMENFRRRFREQTEHVEEDKILIGNEEFFGDYGHYSSDNWYIATPFHDHQAKAEFIARAFDNPKIILTPRRQDLWVESAYMHFIHNYHTLTVEEFLTPDDGLDIYPYRFRARKPCCDYTVLDWSRYVENYYRIFGRENVLVVPHEVVLRDLNAAIDRFAEFIGVPPQYPETVPQVNKSMSKTAWRLAMILNRFIISPRNRLGFIPIQPFGVWINNKRKENDSRLLWFLAGISRRMSLHWFLSDVVGGIKYEKPDILGPERRQKILDHYRDTNRAYAQLIGYDLGKYGYY